nr:trehalose-phosphatase [Rhodothermus marinus]
MIELRPRDVHKGTAVRAVAAQWPDRTPVYIGDDTTDEDAFRALADRGLTIKVGDGATAARYRLPDESAVVAYLRQYLTSLLHPLELFQPEDGVDESQVTEALRKVAQQGQRLRMHLFGIKTERVHAFHQTVQGGAGPAQVAGQRQHFYQPEGREQKSAFRTTDASSFR